MRNHVLSFFLLVRRSALSVVKIAHTRAICMILLLLLLLLLLLNPCDHILMGL